MPFGLNKIANTKHTVLEAVGSAIGGFTAKKRRRGAPQPGASPYRVPSGTAKNNEMIYGKVGPGAEFEYDIEFSFYVAFGDVPVPASEFYRAR